MSIKSYCSECEAQLVDGVMKHRKKCSGNLFQHNVVTDYIRPPAVTLKFDTPEEQEEFMKKLGTTEVGQV